MRGRGLTTRGDAFPDGGEATAAIGPGDRKAPIPPLLLVGCGRMGSAMLDGWQADGLAPSVVLDPAPATVAAPHRLVASAEALDGLEPRFAPAVVVLAVKPQVANETLPALGARFPDALFLSIMAGRTVASIGDALGAGKRFTIVRAMPNIPASIGAGMSGAYAGPDLAPDRHALVGRLLAAVGEVAWVDTEGALDAVTGVSGSGPAYVFLLAELLEQAGIRQGLPPATARRLARATISGAGAMLARDPADARAMREAVTSKAGTTERALAVLMAPDAWPRLVDDAVAAATERARALAS